MHSGIEYPETVDGEADPALTICYQYKPAGHVGPIQRPLLPASPVACPPAVDACMPGSVRRQGWYAADRGPQNALYVPGALLRPCANEVVLLEFNRTSFTAPDDVPAGAG